MSKQTIFDALVGAGMAKEGAAAVIGNMDAESGLKADIAQRGMTKLSDEQYTAAADNGLLDFVRDGVGYGLCQWTHWSRKRNLLQYAKAQGVSVGDEAMQVQFCIRELQSEYQALWKQLCTSHDLLQLTQAVCTEYERPAHNNVGTRYEFAQKALDECGGRPAPEAPVSDACPVFPPDPSVMVIQMVMNYNGYWGNPDGQKTPEFFKALRTFTDDMEKC